MNLVLELIINKLKGDHMELPPRPAARTIFFAWLGSVLAIGLIAGLSEMTSLALLVGSFGASCLLIFGYPDLPFAQPRNVVGGHLLSACIGMLFFTLCGAHWWSMALAAGTAIALMMATRTTHPPAGANPVLVFLTQPTWGFLLFPVAAGLLLLMGVALFFNNAVRSSKYPKYW